MTRSQWDSPWDGWNAWGLALDPWSCSLDPDRYARLCCCLVTKSRLTLKDFRTVALQTPVSMAFPVAATYWSGCCLLWAPSPGLNTGLRHWTGISLSLSHLEAHARCEYTVTSSTMCKAANTGVFIGQGNIAVGEFQRLGNQAGFSFLARMIWLHVTDYGTKLCIERKVS